MKVGMSISIDETTHSKIRELMRSRKFRNKSHLLEEAIWRLHEKEAEELQGDDLRNGVLNKKMKKQSLEKKIILLSEMGVRLTSYVMLKPGPDMTEEEGIDEATATIQYLSDKCSAAGTELVVYLNPTYRVEGSRLEKEMIEKDYKPPMIQSVLQVLTETRHCGAKIYTGLSSEGLSDVDYTSREGYDSRIQKAVRKFNSTQDYEHLYTLQREWMLKLPA